MISKLSNSSLLSKAYYKNMLVGNAAYSPSVVEEISTTILSSSQSSVTFDVSAYASTYKHLELRIVARSDRGIGSDYMRVRFNSDSGSNYSWHNMYGDGSGMYSENTAPNTGMHVDRIAAATSGSDAFGAVKIDIFDAFSTTKNKTIRSFGGTAVNTDSTTRRIHFNSGAWFSTSLVTSINIVIGGGSNFIAGSRFALYGIRG